jgi:hypothetical protein
MTSRDVHESVRVLAMLCEKESVVSSPSILQSQALRLLARLSDSNFESDFCGTVGQPRLAAVPAMTQHRLALALCGIVYPAVVIAQHDPENYVYTSHSFQHPYVLCPQHQTFSLSCFPPFLLHFGWCPTATVVGPAT